MNQNPQNSYGIASLVLGILAVVFLFTGMGSFLSLIIGIVAIVMSSMSKRNFGPNGMATAGLVLGIISVVFGCIVFVACAVCGGLAACAGLFF